MLRLLLDQYFIKSLWLLHFNFLHVSFNIGFFFKPEHYSFFTLSKAIESLFCLVGDNLGQLFYTAFGPVPPSSASSSELWIELITPGLGTEVKVTGELAGSDFIYIAKVKRDGAVIKHCSL